MATDPAALGRQLVETVWAESDRSVAAKIIAADVIVHASRAIDPGPAGQAAIGDYFRGGFSNARWSVEDAFGADDRAAIRWRMVGSHDGEFEAIAATGRSVEFHGIAIVRLASGVIAEIWHAEDMLGLLDQLGVKPETSARG